MRLASTPAGLDISLSFDQPVRAADVSSRVVVTIDAARPAAAALGGSAGAHGARRSGGAEAARRLDAEQRRQLGPPRVLRAWRARDPRWQLRGAALAEAPPRGARVVVTVTGIGVTGGAAARTGARAPRVPSGPLFTATGPDCGGPCDPRLAAIMTSLPVRGDERLDAAIALTDITDPGRHGRYRRHRAHPALASLRARARRPGLDVDAGPSLRRACGRRRSRRTPGSCCVRPG